MLGYFFKTSIHCLTAKEGDMMKQMLKTVFAAMFILMLVACGTSSTSSFGYSSCQPSNIDGRCMFGG